MRVKRTVGSALVEAIGFAEAYKLIAMLTLWSTFLAEEGRDPTKSEFQELLGWDKATVYRRLQLWKQVFPDGPEFKDIAQEIANKAKRRAVSSRAVFRWSLA